MTVICTPHIYTEANSIHAHYVNARALHCFFPATGKQILTEEVERSHTDRENDGARCFRRSEYCCMSLAAHSVLRHPARTASSWRRVSCGYVHQDSCEENGPSAWGEYREDGVSSRWRCHGIDSLHFFLWPQHGQTSRDKYCNGKGKGTVHPRTGHEGLEGE